MHSYTSGHAVHLIVLSFWDCAFVMFNTLQDEMQYIFLQKSLCSWAFQLLKLLETNEISFALHVNFGISNSEKEYEYKVFLYIIILNPFRNVLNKYAQSQVATCAL